MMKKFWNDEAGFIVSAELVLVLTIAVLGTVVGLTAIRDSVANELVDLSSAFGAVDQSYNVTGLAKAKDLGTKPNHAVISGFGFNDGQDNCDCRPLVYADICGKNDTFVGVPENN